MSTIDDIRSHLDRFMFFPDADQSLIVSLWIAHTWTFSESFPRAPWTTPYLYVHSPVKQSGKTLLIDLCEGLSLNPERTVDMTSAALFRLIETVQPTMFIDEVDAIFTGVRNEALRGVLNGGYKHGGYVWRVEGGDARKYRTFCPKLLAGIDNHELPDTIKDRCIPILLQRKPKDETREIFYQFRHGPEVEGLAETIGQAVHNAGKWIIDYEPDVIESISPRAWEISRPLVQIAHAFKCEPQARKALARLLQPEIEDDPEAIQLLRSIRSAFDSVGFDRMFAADILAAVESDLGWKINGKKMGAMLSPFNIGTSSVLTVKNKRARGYNRFQFQKAWETYL